MKIGFIGLGNMGLPMAINLASAGHDVTGFDTAEIEFPERIAPAADSASCVAGCEVVITMLPNGAVCESLFLGSGSADGALLEALRPSTLVLDCSTIDAPTARRIHEGADRAGVAYLDTPVSGGTAVAKAGNLAFMCGGEASVFERARAARHDRVVCEVNLVPPNPGSDAFHDRMGFAEVGRATLGGAGKTVRYLEKLL